MNNIIYILVLAVVTGCASFQPKVFTPAVLDEKLVTLDRDSITFNDIIETNKGKPSFIQVFASYCPYSQDSFDDVLQFQKEHPDYNYIFLSVDHTYHDWKRGLKYLKPKGQFYYVPEKGDSEFGKFIKLKSIPRFLKINKQGGIDVYKTSKVSDKLK